MVVVVLLTKGQIQKNMNNIIVEQKSEQKLLIIEGINKIYLSIALKVSVFTRHLCRNCLVWKTYFTVSCFNLDYYCGY